ncbi:GNAT family N-acetyltransferase [Hydrogenophaga sp. PBL-H3]|uniref:GNAT family N-acetyltransferase n=1 Tax=Hydrogenophaga sp. PBL-H3 TaxID=434010 RepID=UPI00131FCA16|nr:GNAT family N-acetyltransferase [Hydrogenophaga sp. PBL-H3]QHE76527.1 GNAT family N-acetyltransferase [Hydrogenophaga sp. PBL-H3]QHE80951.1 GNAT family N-acetyltransferase [Hydrogenophaga sp. PBL-H3]
MSRFCTRPLAPQDRAAFVEFEQTNREPFEHFNEPHPSCYYSEAGLKQAFDRLMARQDTARFLTRVITCTDSQPWVGKGSLSVYGTGDGAFAMLVYQTDQQHWKQGAAGALLADLVQEATRLRLARADALIASDNLVSLHLLRRAGFTAAGWDAAAALRRGQIPCLRLSRPLGGVVGPVLARAHMHLPA